MFIDINNLRQKREARNSQFEGRRDIRRGYIIEVGGGIEGDRDGLVWFRALDSNSEPFQVFYNGLIGDLRPNMLCRIERNPKTPARWQIIQFDTGLYFDDQQTYEALPSTNFIPNKTDYEWPPGRPGAKALNIYPRQIVGLSVRPTNPTSMKVRVSSGIYAGATYYARFSGPIDSKDFTADIPGTAGLALIAAITIDNTGTLQYYNGSTFVDGLPVPDAALPNIPASEMLISAVRLVSGMTAITEAHFDQELRPVIGMGVVNAKVSEVWESDFGAVAMATDASGNVTINGTRTLTIPTDLIHASDADTLLSFTDDALTITVGGEVMLTLTEDGSQDIVKLGDGGDIDINLNDAAFLEGSSGAFIIGNTDPTFVLQGTTVSSKFYIERGVAGGTRSAVFSAVGGTQSDNTFLRASAGPGAVSDGDVVGNFFYNGHDGTDYNRSARIYIDINGAVAANTVPMAIKMQTSETNSTGLADRLKILATGDIIVGSGSPAAQLHVDQEDATAAQPVLYLDQADISEEMIEFNTTIGVGNAIEAVGAKTLTPTHFIKVTLPGALTRYLQVGTIA